MAKLHWVETGVYGLQARYGDDGRIYTRTAGGIRVAELAEVRRLAALRPAESPLGGPWTPELARTVLSVLGLSAA
ncbi:hypothetical protein LKL35_36730 [Streptomyces sp. ET3-23]|uniref:hypothetical protein n=1 Tax=Streptomyces sp. ET3-23 TaxID=2885643 RepID=UPI001D12EE44|nr:hypothetical protein [Streptomyces sp. ET3-23]MCC2280872.1 hypothetical protein [Streptomyces sp. ET3-23]